MRAAKPAVAAETLEEAHNHLRLYGGDAQSDAGCGQARNRHWPCTAMKSALVDNRGQASSVVIRLIDQ
jgi:hypothetical protein